MKAIACLKIDNLFITSARALHPEWKGLPMVIASKGRVVERCEIVTTLGVEPGWSLNHTRTVCPDSLISVDVEEIDIITLSNIVWDLCAEFSPLVDPLPPNTCLVDLTGCPGGPLSACSYIINTAHKSVSLSTRIGLASSPILARMACESSSINCVNIIDSLDEKKYLENYPITRLWMLPDDVKERLLHLGLKTVGQISTVPIQDLNVQFDDLASLLHDLSKGIDRSHILGLYPPPKISKTRKFEEPISDTSQLDLALSEIIESEVLELSSSSSLCKTMTVLVTSSTSSITKELPYLIKRFNMPSFTRSAYKLKCFALPWLLSSISEPVESISVTLCDFKYEFGMQLGLGIKGLFKANGNDESLSDVIESMNSRHGSGTIKYASNNQGDRREKLLYHYYVTDLQGTPPPSKSRGC